MDWRQVMESQRQNSKIKIYPQYPYNPQNSGSGENIADITDITDKGQKLKLDDREIRYQFEERAGIIEFDNGLSREEAEVLAKSHVTTNVYRGRAQRGN